MTKINRWIIWSLI